MIKLCKSLRLVISLFIILILFSNMQVLYCQEVNEINSPKVFINGKEINFNIKPRLINGIIFVPMAQLIDEIGYYSQWDSNSSTALICSTTNKINLNINKKDALLNDKEILLDEAPVIVDGAVMIPIQRMAGLLLFPPE